MTAVETACAAHQIKFVGVGIPGLDEFLCFLHGFFHAAVQGSPLHELSSHAALLPLMGVGMPVLYLQFTETSAGFQSRGYPALWGLACQFIGMSIEFPLWSRHAESEHVRAQLPGTDRSQYPCRCWAHCIGASARPREPIPARAANAGACALGLIAVPTFVLMRPRAMAHWWPLACCVFQFGPAVGGLLVSASTVAPLSRKKATPRPSAAGWRAAGHTYAALAAAALLLHGLLILELAAGTQKLSRPGMDAFDVMREVWAGWRASPMLAFLVVDGTVVFAAALLFVAHELGGFAAAAVLTSAPAVSPGAALAAALAYRALVCPPLGEHSHRD